METRILELWKSSDAFALLVKKNQDKPRWSFLDGPITANNPMGVHHAWGRSLKDMYQRFHAMCGKQQRFQNGFDCQGLWVEVEVEKSHGFKTKQDIEEYGMARFVEDCKERVRKFSKIQTDQSIRLGYWMDWDSSYFTMTDDNNYTIWSFLKRCFDRGFIYKGVDSMPWCPRCGVGLSEMEMHEGYKWVKDPSVIIRFPFRDRDHEALLVWTTTPWTLTSNVAAAVNPEMTYYKIRQGDWTYYAGAENWDNQRRIEIETTTATGKKREVVQLQTIAKHLEKHGPVEVVGSVRGEELVGLEYEGPFDSLPAQHECGGYPFTDAKLSDRAGISCHRVIPWEEVSGGEGTGVVHIAPGCGKEDFLLGQEHGLVAISPLDDNGCFLDRFGWLHQRGAQEAAQDIISDLGKRQVLVGAEQYPHRYPHCWRCGTAIVFRSVDEWFISMDWRDEIMKVVPQIRWIPSYGEQRESDWLRNMGDWMISKKRYWGLALPIWQCDHHDEADPEARCSWFTVVGSREELQQRAISGWHEFDGNSPHRPWVDAVKLRCEKCGETASRVADVGNPWLDAGIVPYSTMGYNSNRDYWQKWFPADLVLECFPGQFRNWFYALLAMSTMMQEDRWADRQDGESTTVPPFNVLLGYALVLDEEGREMHKSLGNAIEFNYAAETIGAEVMRYIFATQNPTKNLRFPDISPDRRKDVVHVDQEVQRELLTLWNCYSFYVTYAEIDGVNPQMLTVPLAERSELDRWIISKYQMLVKLARECFEDFRIHLLMLHFERFLEDLSNWYLRRSRRRFWKSESDTDKLAAFTTLYEVLEGVCRVMAPVLPFLSEEIYQNIVRGANQQAPVSIHLCDYPEYEPDKVDEGLATRIDVVVKYKNLGLGLRNQSGLKVRQPLARIAVCPGDQAERSALSEESLRSQLLTELNIKQLELLDSTEGMLKTEVRPNFKTLGPKYGRMMKGIQSALVAVDPSSIESKLASDSSYTLEVEGSTVILTPEDLEIRHTAPEGLAFTVHEGAFVAIETTITPELKREGVARDFVRGVQNVRKEIDLNVADRIHLRFHTDNEETMTAIGEWHDYISRETLALEITDDAQLDETTARSFKVAGAPVLVAIEVVK
jgi:isoleucyl-tRNA synthetase